MEKKEYDIFKGRTAFALCIMSVAVMVVAYAIFMYTDITNTIDNSVLLLRALFEGRIGSYYEYTVEHASTGYAANYNFFVYIVYELISFVFIFIPKFVFIHTSIIKVKEIVFHLFFS